jgi:CobQ/CobB/MinD/ParA nucleotide binding domain
MPDTNLPDPPSGTTASPRKESRNSSSAPASSPSGGGRTMRKVHTILAPKGGCGKTYVASLIAQALQEKGEPVVCFDTDRENASLRDITALAAQPVGLFLPNSDEIDVRAMDAMTERMLTEDANFVVDNGATSFAPLSRYLVQDGIADALAEAGKKMTVHMIVAGGQELVQTIRGFDSVASQFPSSVEMVLWLNEHHGGVDGADGSSFEDTPVYQKHKGRLLAAVRLARQHPGTFGVNLSDMLTRGMTFAEADKSPEFFVIAKQRLRQVWRPIRDQLAPVL